MNPQTFIIGRKPNASYGEIPITVNDPMQKVSSNHCRITFDGVNYFIEDTVSTNGTFVNGQRVVGRTSVTVNDSITLGKVFPFHLSNLTTSTQQANQQLGQVSASKTSIRHADWGTRFGAHILDILFFNLVNTPAFIFIYVVGLSGNYDDGVVALAIVLTIIAYFVIFHFYYAVPISKSGQTWGKKLMNIKVLNSKTKEIPSIGQGWGRELSKVISGLILMIGYFMPLWTKDKQALHDMMASTLVVKS